jgi:glycosyltransferase involved in cell wall biosynthesis
LAATRNAGIDYSCGKYLIFLDADDELLPQSLSRLQSAICQRPEASLLIGDYISVKHNGREKYRSAGIINNHAKQRFEDYLHRKINLANVAVAMKRDIFTTIRYPEHMRSTEDIPVWAQCMALFTCHPVPFPLAKIHHHPGSLRHQVHYAQQSAAALIDTLFDPTRLPAELIAYRPAFQAQYYLELFRICYRAKEYKRACHCYQKAIQSDGRNLLRWRHWHKWLISYLLAKR